MKVKVKCHSFLKKYLKFLDIEIIRKTNSFPIDFSRNSVTIIDSYMEHFEELTNIFRQIGLIDLDNLIDSHPYFLTKIFQILPRTQLF